MCGIVLAGSSQFLSQGEVSLFEKLVYHDTIRGSHSTGVYAGYSFSYPKQDQYVIYGKTAQPGPEFLESKTWDSISSQDYKNGTTVNKRFPYFLVGHNRYATMGAKTAENAHPFVSGKIMLVHNGTLSNQSLLPDWKDFEVDSANICHAIDKQGIDKTLQQLDGAFTLVWYNDEEKTLNIIRNEERPFHLARTSGGSWFGASEEEMLMWIIQRDDKYSIAKSSPKIVEHFECEVGVQYVFDVGGGRFSLVDQIKHNLPTFTRGYYRYGSYSGWDDLDDDDYSYNYPYGSNNFQGKGTSGTTTAKTNVTNLPVAQRSNEEKIEEILKEGGIPNARIGSKLWFVSEGFELYPSGTGRGRLFGKIDKHDKEVLVTCHAFDEKEFELEAFYQAEVISVYKLNGVVNLIVKNATTNPPEDMTVDFSDTVVMEDCEVYTKDDWDKSSAKYCVDCNTAIPFDEAELASVKCAGYICQQCKDEATMADIDSKLVEEEDAGVDDAPFRLGTFICRNCGEEKEEDEESSQLPGSCCSCHYQFFERGEAGVGGLIEQTKELDNGEVVTKKQWEAMNTCSHCNTRVSFESAEYCLIEQGHLLCINCYI